MANKVFDVVNAGAESCLILTCEHAGAGIPAEYHNLGLSAAELNRHIARDKGAREVTLSLAEKLGCRAVLGVYSRLLIDLNRRINEDELIVAESDRTPIPGNAGITEAERQKRIELFYRPYYQALAGQIAAVRQTRRQPVIFSIHSFTPQLKGGKYRPWQAGILYHNPTRLAAHLYRELSAAKDKVIGENVPYDLRQYNTGTAVICGEEQGLDYALIEIRDDEFDNMAQGAADWTERLVKAFKKYPAC